MVRHETAVATVAWWLNELLAIVLIRRSDTAMAFVEVPEPLRSDLVQFNRDAVIEHADSLRQAVLWSLPDASFVIDDDIGAKSLRDGATPAELGSIRRFQTAAIGVDIGEFPLPNPALRH